MMETKGKTPQQASCLGQRGQLAKAKLAKSGSFPVLFGLNQQQL